MKCVKIKRKISLTFLVVLIQVFIFKNVGFGQQFGAYVGANNFYHITTQSDAHCSFSQSTNIGSSVGLIYNIQKEFANDISIGLITQAPKYNFRCSYLGGGNSTYIQSGNVGYLDFQSTFARYKIKKHFSIDVGMGFVYKLWDNVTILDYRFLMGIETKQVLNDQFANFNIGPKARIRYEIDKGKFKYFAALNAQLYFNKMLEQDTYKVVNTTFSIGVLRGDIGVGK